MYTRLLTKPNLSFFLFGPRATGKTTWLRDLFHDAMWFNLLLDADLLPILGDTKLFRERVEAAPPGSWIIVDEVQRAPGLLNEVHDLLSRRGNKYKFALSGSSARKLKRFDINLLAGRAVQRSFFPLTATELGSEFDIDRALQFGTLPIVCADAQNRIDILRAYTGTYLREEIRQEALVKDIGSFHRFLKIAALFHGQVINYSGISRDAAVARPTVQRYFETLVDTLIGSLLPAWRPRAKVREYGSPKFYFFDCGLVRVLNDTVDEPLSENESGSLMEGYVFHELKAALSYQGLGGELFYWCTPGSKEVDFIYVKGKKAIGIEVKSSRRWRSEFSKTLNELIDAGFIKKGVVVYRGKEIFKSGAVMALPVEHFLCGLYQGFFTDF